MDNKGLHEVRGYMRLQGFTLDNKGLHEVARGYKGLHEVTRGDSENTKKGAPANDQTR